MNDSYLVLMSTILIRCHQDVANHYDENEHYLRYVVKTSFNPGTVFVEMIYFFPDSKEDKEGSDTSSKTRHFISRHQCIQVSSSFTSEILEIICNIVLLFF